MAHGLTSTSLSRVPHINSPVQLLQIGVGVSMVALLEVGNEEEEGLPELDYRIAGRVGVQRLLHLLPRSHRRAMDGKIET